MTLYIEILNQIHGESTVHFYTYKHFSDCSRLMVIPAVAMSEASDCGRSLPGIAGSNHARGTDVCLL